MKSILETHPEIAKQWHPTKNGDLKPEMFSYGMHRKVWWLCENECHEGCLHEWETFIDTRIYNNRGCPFCSDPPIKHCKHKSIAYTHPELSKQWHPTKNGNLKNEDFTFGSNQKVWWLCNKTKEENDIHEWESTINNRSNGGKGCPFCLKRPGKVCKSDSITYTHPEIVKQWHPTKNGELKPEMFSFGSGKKIWWLCDNTCPEGCKHEWESSIVNRISKNCNCPYCSKPRKKSCKHVSIVNTHPEIIKQWHPTKNGKLKPEDFTSGSAQKVWWLCDKTCPQGCKHEWETAINNRSNDKDCPYCCFPQLKNCKHESIVATHPEITKQWHPTKNIGLKPEDFTFGSGQKVWWLCDKTCPEGCKHEWETDIQHRTSRKSGCPYCCENPRQLCDHVSIVHTHPDIVKQWHPTKNIGLKPEDFTFGSSKKVWWLCDKTCPEGCKHEWESSILDRCGNKSSGCPYCCEPRKNLCEHESIVYTHPEIVNQWHPTKNEDLKPENFSFGSSKKIWWLCEKNIGHEWCCEINSRCGYMSTGCPCCINKTEEKLKKYLLKYFNEIIPQYKEKWCKYPHNNSYFRFDFMVKEFNLIIELDGNQHFIQAPNWQSPLYNQLRDVFKMKEAIKKGFSIIRLLQEDVWNNEEKWLDETLLSKIMVYKEPQVLYIDKKDLYKEHKKLMLLEEINLF